VIIRIVYTLEAVRISFQHANPDAGNESFLLRFETGNDETLCVLVDAGHGVDLDALLEPSDRLGAIGLTHAHADHYASLADVHRDDIPIITSPATAAVLEDVLDIADAEHNVTRSVAVDDAVTPTEDWFSVAPDVEMHPVPAGHIPGATGFLVRATEGDRSHHLLATGDFTVRRAGGFLGFDPDGFVDIDTLFLTAATSDSFETPLTDALGTALEHAHGGAPTLVTTSGIVGPQIAYLLSALADEHGLQVSIRVVGQAAKLYEALGYDCSHVEPVPYFEDTSDCLGRGAIAVAGPDVPRERSSGRLFGVLRENPSACVVQLVGSGDEPISGGRCTIHSYELINHPTRETLVEVHDALDPRQTVITHRHGGSQREFNELSSAVWGAGDTNEYTLFDGQQWQLPPWMDGQVVSSSKGRSVKQFADADVLASLSVPSLDRGDEPDLEAEGIDTEQIGVALHRGSEAAVGLDAPGDPDGRSDADAPKTETISTTMSRNGDDSNEQDDESSSSKPSTGLIRTTGPDLDDLDPALETALDEQSITIEEFSAMLTARKRLAANAPDDDGEESTEKAGRDDVTDPIDDDDSTEAVDGTKSEGEASTTTPVDAADQEESPAEATSIGASEAESGDSTAEPVPEPRETEATSSDETVSNERVDVEPAERSDRVIARSPLPEDDTRGPKSTEAMTLDLNPLAVALAGRIAMRGSGDEEDAAPVDEAIVEAVDEYVVALLAGDASGTDDERFAVDIDASRTVDRALTNFIREDDRFDSTAALVASGVASILDSGPSRTRDVSDLDAYRRHLDAIRDNDAYAFSDTVEIVEAAIVWSAIHE